MQQDFAQRRRVALAVAITVILVPAALLLNRGGQGAATEPGGTLVGQVLIPGQTVAPEPSSGPSDGPSATDPMGTTPIEFVEGTVPPEANDPATIAIPRLGQSMRGGASFSRNISDPTSCQVLDVATIPFGSSVTVTNLDNSRSVQCIANVGGVAPDADVVLSSEAFLLIGDLTDAPLSVELSW